ncbi:MAG: matrixin family metalloprotease [Clostridia bacterium]|nr:matrixin family metalloprotease [Clostridia bacterium]
MSFKKIVCLCVFSFSLSLMLCLSIGAYAYTHKGLQTIPSQIYISTTLTDDQLARTQDAMSTWNTTCFAYDHLVYAGRTNISSSPVEDDTNTITFLNSSESYLGYTYYVNKKYTFLWLNWYLEEFDMNINASKTWYTGESESDIRSIQYDFESVVLHELGHVLGLDHTDEYSYALPDGTFQDIVMYSALPSGSVVRKLSEDDRLGIVNLY